MALSISFTTGHLRTDTGTRRHKTLYLLLSSWFFSVFCMLILNFCIYLLRNYYLVSLSKNYISDITFLRPQDLPAWRIQLHFFCCVCLFLKTLISNNTFEIYMTSLRGEYSSFVLVVSSNSLGRQLASICICYGIYRM